MRPYVSSESVPRVSIIFLCNGKKPIHAQYSCQISEKCTSDACDIYNFVQCSSALLIVPDFMIYKYIYFKCE